MNVATTAKRLSASEQLDSIRDLAMEKGSYVIERASLGRYLEQLGLFDSTTQVASFDASAVGAAFQRATLDIRKNPIKQRMLRDVLRGGSVPPIVVFQRPDRDWEIVDGLQRTHVLTEALRATLAHEKGERLEDFAQTQFAFIQEHGQRLLASAELMERPIVLQVWRDLIPEELIRLFIVLNVGQQKVSPRHLLEVVHADLRDMFESWGLRLLSEKEEKAIPRRRGRRSPETFPIPSITHFRYEFLIDGLIAYVSRDPQVKTRTELEDDEGTNKRLGERVTEIGSEGCKSDFQWACLELNKLINKRYADVPKWRGIIQTSDNFFIPLMAALGEARANSKSRMAIDERQQALLSALKSSSDDDPLCFARGTTDSLEVLLENVKSNIGRRRRAIVYFAWRSFFREGPYSDGYPLDWRGAAVAD
jgi:hypothetical protein